MFQLEHGSVTFRPLGNYDRPTKQPTTNGETNVMAHTLPKIVFGRKRQINARYFASGLSHTIQYDYKMNFVP